MGEKNGKSVTIDRGHNIPVYSPVCTHCKHLIIKPGERICKAFPDGIPLEIWLGLNKHTVQYPGDQGIRFERASKG
jgi:hypothetical protein